MTGDCQGDVLVSDDGRRISRLEDGDRDGALTLYKRYLGLDPDGQAAQVAAEEIASIEQQLAEERRPEAEAAEARRAELEEAQRLADRDRARRRWQAAEALRRAGDPARAADEYRAALAAAPADDHGFRARAWLELEVALAEAGSPPAVVLVPPTDAVVDVDREIASETRRISSLFLAGLALVSGLALDLVPASSNNGTFEVVDLAPLACYGFAATIGAVWAF